MKQALAFAIRRLPPSVIRFLGRAQFRFPLLSGIAARANQAVTASEGTIAHGVGAGLLFDARGGYSGYLLGTSEPEEQEFLAHHLKSGDVFYDIGANVGFFATIAARLVGEDGSVFAFEPFAASAQAARSNAERNGFSHLVVVEAAVADVSGEMVLDTAGGSAKNRLSEDGTVTGPTVTVVAIDEWRMGGGAPPPQVVMLDVEGAELRVLAGMLGTLVEHRPLIVCEVHWLGNDFFEFVDKYVLPIGYRLLALDGEVPVKPVRWHAVLQPVTDS